MHELSNEERALLLDLFEFQDGQQHVDPSRFRLRHERGIEQIDSLINHGYIREQAGRYSLSLLALGELKTSDVDELLNACDVLWSELQIQYRENLTDQIPLAQLASETGLTIEIVRKAMIYMIEFPWYAGYSGEFPFHEDASIGPSEKVIRLSTFGHAIAELRSWKMVFQDSETEHGLQFPIRKKSAIPTDETGGGTGTSWYTGLQEPFATILREVIGARVAGYRTIAAMGARAVIDLVCTEIVGDKSAFKQKIEEIQRLGHLNSDECAAVATAFDAGSASAHRGYLISEQNLNNLIEIMDHLLRRRFRLGQAAHDIKASTPQRVRSGKLV